MNADRLDKPAQHPRLGGGVAGSPPADSPPVLAPAPVLARGHRASDASAAGQRIIIGIDPGVSTGYAEYDPVARKLLDVRTLRIDEAMDEVINVKLAGTLALVLYEDARLRTWLGAKGREALQGAGSIKRDCKIWADFLHSYCIQHRGVKPQAGASKWDATRFARVTGWPGRTSEHARDAALLVWGMRA